MALTPPQRARLYVACCFLGLGCFHVAFLFLALRWSWVLPLGAGLVLLMVSSGYASPPVGNRTGPNEAGRLLGWSGEKTRLMHGLMIGLAMALAVDAVLVVGLG
jgi:hypothetical protein